MSTQELDRSMLDAKDREELHAIAGAMGVKAPTRMRKSELIDAILDAAEGGPAGDTDAGDGDGADAPRRTIRSARASELAADSVAALIAEEEALPAVEAVEPSPQPPRTPTPTRETTDTPESTTTPTPTSTTSTSAPATTSHPRRVRRRTRLLRRRQQPAPSSPPRRPGRPRRRPGAPLAQEPVGEPVEVHGLLELRDEGYGFLRTTGYLAGARDVYVSASQVRRFALRKGDYLDGFSRPQASNEKYPALLRVDQINGMTPDDARDRPHFEDLTALFPDEKLRLELADNPLETTGRIIDLVSPVGKGQRGLIVSPPKAGKTTILKQLVYSIERNNPEVHLIVLLVDERPEEVTDMRRHVVRGDVVSSTFDRPAEEHTTVAELAIERAKRLVEQQVDVVVVLDGITRLARAHNLAAPASGRILSGGVDSTALYPPKRFFGAARNIEEGGSLTIIATALDRHRQPHGRGDLRGVQGHRQHGAAPRPAPRRAAHLPGDRRRAVEHPPRGAAVRAQPAEPGLEAAARAERPRRRRVRRQGPRAAARQAAHHEEQRRVPRRGREGPHPRRVAATDADGRADSRR